MPHWWGKRAPGIAPPEAQVSALSASECTRRGALGVRSTDLVGCWRLVVPAGCGHDCAQTRAMLLPGAARGQVAAAIQALIARGAPCDGAVFPALGAPPRGVLWHHRPDPLPSTGAGA